MISKFDQRKLALSMSSTNVGKNRYRSISLILTLEQNILIMITSWENKRNKISKFDQRKLALSMSSTKVGKNHYRSISLILTLEQIF